MLLGSSSSGKSCFFNYLKGSKYHPELYETTFIDRYQFGYLYQDEIFRVEIWDTPGNERLRNLAKIYYNKQNCFIIFYDVCGKYSYDDIKIFINNIQNELNYNKEKIIFIVGNKIDEFDKRKIWEEEGENIARKYNAEYFEISCKTGEGLEELVNAMIIINKYSNSSTKKLQSLLENKPLKKKNKKAE